jgi:GMP synthase PP-ATPase subunit
MNLKLPEPLRELFRDEVMALGRDEIGALLAVTSTDGMTADYLFDHVFPGGWQTASSTRCVNHRMMHEHRVEAAGTIAWQ